MSRKYGKVVRALQEVFPKKDATLLRQLALAICGEIESEYSQEDIVSRWISAMFPPENPRPVEIRYPDVIDLKGYYLEKEKQWYLWGPIVIKPIEIPAPIAWREIKSPELTLRIFSIPDGWNNAITPPNDNRRVTTMLDDKSEKEGFYSEDIGWYVNSYDIRPRWVIAWREILPIHDI